MKLFGSLVGLAAALSVVPYKVEKKECGEKKSYSLTSLTWKANYTPDTETEEGTLSIDLLGGLMDTVDTVKDFFFTKEANEDFSDAVVMQNTEDEKVPTSAEETVCQDATTI